MSNKSDQPGNDLYHSLESFRQQLNAWSQNAVPFFFLVDFEMNKPFACRLEDAAKENILYDFAGVTNCTDKRVKTNIVITKSPLPFEDYQRKFNELAGHLSFGNSFITNLTIRTSIGLDRSIRETFNIVKAKYKLFFKDQFLVFSPETFVRIRGGRISTYPMKGTIDVAIPGSEQRLLDDKKELAEHVTIVDLLRNDLSQVAEHVEVNRFRYLEKIKTNDKSLWQMSSEISGVVLDDFKNSLGDLLVTLLPAGSISGAPKTKTVEIIASIEGEPRGYYTGVAGYFDGVNFDSTVMIRFIEQRDNELYYRSGGGITTQSAAMQEYREAIDKIYVPVN